MKKIKKPISRKFWNYLKYLPAPLQAKFIRSKFEVSYDLPSDIIIKLAETEDELKQALKLVHDSYVELNYINTEESELRFTKFHALPTTVIFIAKVGDEVIGTIAIIPDSALGLPVEMTWPIDKYRENGSLIAEVSSIAIKKNHRRGRGKLMLPLCKIMINYCLNILKLDGIVIATTIEVEPFYVHVLLFEKVVPITGQSHSLVKGNPSTCCFLPLNKDSLHKFKKIYDHKPLKSNFYRFLFASELANIKHPDSKISISTYNQFQNISKTQIMKTHPNLIHDWSAKDQLIISNLNINNNMANNLPDSSTLFNVKLLGIQNRESDRFGVRLKSWAFYKGEQQPIECQIVDVSNSGFQIRSQKSSRTIEVGEIFYLMIEINNHFINASALIKWINKESIFGCSLNEKSEKWNELIHEIKAELVNLKSIDTNLNISTKKTA